MYKATYIYLSTVHTLFERGQDFNNGTLIRLTAAATAFKGMHIAITIVFL